MNLFEFDKGKVVVSYIRKNGKTLDEKFIETKEVDRQELVNSYSDYKENCS